MSAVRVGIVNDLRMAAEVLRRIVDEMPGFEVAWIAADGREALARHFAAPAEVVLMDLLLPGADGAEVTGQLMAARPCAILVVTASVTDNRELVFQAMSRGALDAVNLPAGTSAEGSAQLRRKLLTISRLVAQAAPLPGREMAAAEPAGEPGIVAIGASTGGPQAICTLLRALPGDYGAAVVIAQHLDEQFVPGLQRWLQPECALPVKLAAGGERLRAGTVWLAQTGDHLVVRAGAEGARLEYTPEPREALHRPSVDVLFRSMARLHGARSCGVLLTGMGADGAAGLLELRRAGGMTLAQDSESCVVYGMPRMALELGAVASPSTLLQIAARMIEFAGKGRVG